MVRSESYAQTHDGFSSDGDSTVFATLYAGGRVVCVLSGWILAPTVHGWARVCDNNMLAILFESRRMLVLACGAIWARADRGWAREWDNSMLDLLFESRRMLWLYSSYTLSPHCRGFCIVCEDRHHSI